MKTWIDFDDAPVFAIPSADGAAVCEGMLIEGPQGWGEFSAPPPIDERRAARWLTAAIEVGTVGWPDPVRGRVPVAVTVPPVEPGRAHRIVAASDCRTATVAVGAGDAGADADRLEAVRDAIGPDGHIRCDAAGAWSPETAAAVVPMLDRAAGGLQFVADPCATLAEIRSVRARLDVAVAAGWSVCADAEPDPAELAGAADVAVLNVAALGGVRRALLFAESCGLPCVVRSGRESSVATAGGLALAGALAESAFAHELGGVVLLAGDLVSPSRSLIPADGHLPVAPMPPAPDSAQLVRFAHPAPGWWRERLRAVQHYI